MLITTDIYGCKDTAFQDKYIRINGPTANFSAVNTSGCKGLDVQFSDHSTTDGLHPITAWNWQYGDGKADTVASNADVQHMYNLAGSFSPQLVLTDAAGCKDSLRLNNLVNTTAPKIQFGSADTLTCLGSTVQFYNQTALTTMTPEWFFGDGAGSTLNNPQHIYSDTGAYTVSLKVTDAAGCSDSIGVSNFVTIKKTTASFLPSDSVGGCTPFKVNFTNTSNFYTASSWDFGTSMSSSPNSSTIYQQAGTFPVTLVVKGRGGCTDTAHKTIVIYSDSLIKFSYSPLDGCKSVFLSTSVSSPTKMTYSWDFGDGTLITTKSNDTTHLYTTAGDYIPRLIVTDSGNCVLPFFGTDTIHVKGITAKFGWDKRLLCDSGKIQFTDSTKSTESLTAFNWSFGDGQTSVLQSPSHHYQQPGNYTVSLSAETVSACRDTMTLQTLVKVVQSPVISILGDTVICQDAPLMHTGVFLRSDTSAVLWRWTFPNGNAASGFNPPSQQYPTAGDFLIKAVAVNSSGCADTATKMINVLPLPNITAPASFTSLVGTPVQIQPVSYSPNVVRFEWTPTAGLSCTDCPQPVAKPKFNTLYSVAVTDSNGCRNSTSVQVIVLCQNANVFVPNTFSPNGDG
ncbi:MAG TPA: PKD domain-containing protein, partial [Flavisolibacter sp.]|nr:PKD domain-containing protein [Flavisolibacter sp.]